ncbi:MAG: hypothetical protein ACRD1H_02400, partial [Vicinamibacterales bacterium]
MGRSGTRAQIIWPLAILAVYLTGMAMWPKPQGWAWVAVFSEQGIIELATAALFALTAVGAVRLFRKTRERVPLRHRLVYLLVAVAAAFVTLEEISYGQHVLAVEPPRWFADYSSKPEVNLHNLFDNFLSHRLNAAATVAFPLACIVLPWLATRRKLWDKTDHWVHSLLPRRELVLLVVLAQLATWFD